jgi:hypothetical protein
MQRASLAIACLALFAAFGGPSQAQKITSALKKDEVRTQHIRNGHVISSDLKDGTVKSVDVKDGGLDGVDVAKSSGEVTRDFGTIPAHGCRGLLVSGISDGNDRVLISPSANDVDPDDEPLTFYASSPEGGGAFGIVACNVSAGAVDPAPIDFNYLVFD